MKKKLLARLIIRLIPLFFAGQMLSQVVRSNIAYAQLEMGTELGLSTAAFGTASGLFFAGYALVQIPANQAIVLFGAPRILGGCLFGSTILSAATGLAQGKFSLFVIRFGLGLVEGSYLPGMTLCV